MPTSIGWTAESLRLDKTTTFKLSRGKNFSYPGFVFYTCFQNSIHTKPATVCEWTSRLWATLEK